MRILIFDTKYNSNPLKAPRVQNEITCLNHYGAITVYNRALDKKISENLNYKKIQHWDGFILRFPVIKVVFGRYSFLLSLVKKKVTLNLPVFLLLYINLYKVLKKNKKSLVIVHHLDTLQQFTFLKRIFNFRLIVNLHEFYPQESTTDSSYNQKQHILAKLYLKKADFLLVVNETLRLLYIDKYSLDINKSITFYNSKPFTNLSELKINYRTKSIFKLIHHGLALEGRYLEGMIYMMKFLPDNFELNLMLVPNNLVYYNELKKLAFHDKRIVFREPVDFKDIISEISKYNIAVYYLKNNIVNHEYASPNKLFEFVQARLPIVTTPNIEMKKFVEENDLGVVASDFTFEEMANAIIACTNWLITKEQSHFDSNAKKLSLENEKLNFLNLL